MKVVLFFSIVFMLFSLTSCGTNPPTDSTVTQDASTSYIQPERKVDLYGKIVSQEGNEITLLEVDTSKDPTFTMTPDEKKKYMQSLEESARMALKEEINNATLGEVKLTIPVGIPMIKKTASGPDAPSVEASLVDLKTGQYLSVWLNQEVSDQKVAEFVKIAFTQ